MRKLLWLAMPLVATLVVAGCSGGDGAERDRGAADGNRPPSGAVEPPGAVPSAAAAAAPAATLDDPLMVGQPAALEDVAGGALELEVNSVELDAGPAVQAAAPFNQPAPAGQRYVLVNVTATFAGADDGVLPGGLALAVGLAVVGPSGTEYGPAVVAAPEPQLTTFADLADGASITGNVVFAVAEDAVAEAEGAVAEGDDELLLRARNAGCTSACGELWFALG